MSTPQTTHWDGCATDGGPAHYECAVGRIRELEAELARVREALQPARDALAAIDSSTDEARQRTGRMAEDACFYAAQRALMALDAARASGSNDIRHVCGERGYNRMIDSACPACEQSRHNAARKETSHD